MATACKPVRIQGKMRKLCWGPKRIAAHTGIAITSNTAVGGGGKPKKAKKAKKATKATKAKKAKKGVRGWW